MPKTREEHEAAFSDFFHAACGVTIGAETARSLLDAPKHVREALANALLHDDAEPDAIQPDPADDLTELTRQRLGLYSATEGWELSSWRSGTGGPSIWCVKAERAGRIFQVNSFRGLAHAEDAMLDRLDRTA